MIDRTPPQDTQAEQAVLGSAMISRTAARDVVDLLSPRDFYHPKHEQIFIAIAALEASGHPADPLTVAAVLERRGELTKVGDRPYLAELVSSVGVAANAIHYAEIVRNKAGLRRLIDAATSVTQSAYESSRPADDLAEDARALFDRAMPTLVAAESYAEALPRVVDSMESGTSRGLPSGWWELDDYIHGLQPGKVYVIGARPGIGKSIAALQLATYMSEAHQRATYFASLEMSTDEIIQRSIAFRARVSLTRVIRGGLSENDWASVAVATDDLQDTRVHVADDPRQTIGTIRAGARTLARRAELGLVVIDYLQLMSVRDPKLPREQQIAEMSRGAKQLAKELSVPVLLLSQLNRASLARSDKTPTLADLRESGSIEQDADVVLLLHAPIDGGDLIEMYVAKNRSGPQGMCQFTRQGEYARLNPNPRPLPHP